MRIDIILSIVIITFHLNSVFLNLSSLKHSHKKKETDKIKIISP